MSAASDMLRQMAAQATTDLVARQLDHRGWSLVHAKTLDVDLVVVRDARVAVPVELAAVPRFTLEEFRWIGTTKPSLDRLRAIVDAKREIPGTQIAMGVA